MAKTNAVIHLVLLGDSDQFDNGSAVYLDLVDIL